MDIVSYNRKAWDEQVGQKNKWTIPVSKEEIDKAAGGNIQVVLTPTKKVPLDWFPQLKNANVLCLASGGGQQVPLFAAAGANVTSFDNSELQLAQDEKVCSENNLLLKAIQGDMKDLSPLENESFDFVFNPCSVSFVEDVKLVWKEVYRVLKKGGVFITGFYNPITLLFNEKDIEQKNFVIKYSQPYSDLSSLSSEELQEFIDKNEPLIHGHSLNDLIGEQMRLGFRLTDMFEDDYGGSNGLDKFFPGFIATRAVK